MLHFTWYECPELCILLLLVMYHQWTISPVSNHKMQCNLDNLRWNFKQYIADFAIQIALDFFHYSGWIINISRNNVYMYISDPKISRVPSRLGLFPYVQTRLFHVRYIVNDDFTTRQCLMQRWTRALTLPRPTCMCTPYAYMQLYFLTIRKEFYGIFLLMN